jgi:hypothetical protein
MFKRKSPKNPPENEREVRFKGLIQITVHHKECQTASEKSINCYGAKRQNVILPSWLRAFVVIWGFYQKGSSDGFA